MTLLKSKFRIKELFRRDSGYGAPAEESSGDEIDLHNKVILLATICPRSLGPFIYYFFDHSYSNYYNKWGKNSCPIYPWQPTV